MMWRMCKLDSHLTWVNALTLLVHEYVNLNYIWEKEVGDKMIAIEEQMKKVLEEAKVVKEVADQIIGRLLEDEKKKIFD